MKMFKYYIAILIHVLTLNSYSQYIKSVPESEILIFPQPKSCEFLGKAIVLENNHATIPVHYFSKDEKKAADYLKKLVKSKSQINLGVLPVNDAKFISDGFRINLSITKHDPSAINDQYYTIQYSEKSNQITIASPSLLGLLYGVVTFNELILSEGNTAAIELYNIKDWPTYRRRIFPTLTNSTDVIELLDFALHNKIETIALASRQYSWKKVDKEYMDVLQQIKYWKDKYGSPYVMQQHNIYSGESIEISNDQDINGLLQVIETAILKGSERLMILADDTPPFVFGQGYVLTSKKDKEKFTHMAEAHCYLMQEISQWLQKNSYHCELYYVPAFYTYEDAKYGDMMLYKNTPWEEDSFGPLKRDLSYIGQHMPAEVFILWTGPNVRSRHITTKDLHEWKNNLMGRIPFLWDNTIYSHHPFTTIAFLSAYSNDLPSDFSDITAGNGMLINGNINSEDMKVAALTANDFLWNPEGYDPEKSLHTAIRKLYGEASLAPLLRFKNVELNLRKKIGERALWFETDTLWKRIVKTKEITGKNPFHYHLNYSQLKALRMQLKYSLPMPVSKPEFRKECMALEKERNRILNEIKVTNLKIFEYLREVKIPVPNFADIK